MSKLKSRRILVGIVAVALLGGATAAVAQFELTNSESWVFTIAHVEGAQLRVYRDQARKTTCYFWRQSVSCVRE